MRRTPTRPRLAPFLRTAAAIAAIAAIAAMPTGAHAQRVTARADLLSFLGASAVTEDFEDVEIPGTTLAFGQVPVLDAGTSTAALPAGSIVEGLALRNPNGSHSFHAPRYGLLSQAYAGGSSTLDLEFAAGTRAVGFDLMNFSFVNPQPGSITFLAADGATLGSISTVMHGGVYGFYGWRSEGADIARVRLSGFYPTGASSPNVDDVTFGVGPAPVTTTTPEPATLALLAGGLATVGGVATRRRRASA